MQPGDELSWAILYGDVIWWPLFGVMLSLGLIVGGVLADWVARWGAWRRRGLGEPTTLDLGPVVLEGVLRGGRCESPTGDPGVAWTVVSNLGGNLGLPRGRADDVVLEVSGQELVVRGAIDVITGSRQWNGGLPLGWLRFGRLKELRRRHLLVHRVVPSCRTLAAGDQVQVRGVLRRERTDARGYREHAGQFVLESTEALVPMVYLGAPKTKAGGGAMLVRGIVACGVVLAISTALGHHSLYGAWSDPEVPTWKSWAASIDPTARGRLLRELDGRRGGRRAHRWRLAYLEFRGRHCSAGFLGLEHATREQAEVDERTSQNLAHCHDLSALHRRTEEAYQRVDMIDASRHLAAAPRSGGTRPGPWDLRRWPVHLMAGRSDRVIALAADATLPELHSPTERVDASARVWLRYAGCASAYLGAAPGARAEAVGAFLESPAEPVPWRVAEVRMRPLQMTPEYLVDRRCDLLAASASPDGLDVRGAWSSLLSFGAEGGDSPSALLAHLRLPEPKTLLTGALVAEGMPRPMMRWMLSPLAVRRALALLEDEAFRQRLVAQDTEQEQVVTALRATLAERAGLFEALTGHSYEGDLFFRQAVEFWGQAQDPDGERAALERAALVHLRLQQRWGATKWLGRLPEDSLAHRFAHATTPSSEGFDERHRAAFNMLAPSHAVRLLVDEGPLDDILYRWPWSDLHPQDEGIETPAWAVLALRARNPELAHRLGVTCRWQREPMSVPAASIDHDPRDELDRAVRRHARNLAHGCESDSSLLDALHDAWLTPTTGHVLALAPSLHPSLVTVSALGAR